MKSLLNTTDRRRIELLELLFLSPGQLTLREISNQLNSSVRVIREDIKFMDQRQCNLYCQIVSDDKGVSAKFKDSFGIDKIAEIILKDSIAFNIIEHLFYVEATSLEELAIEFHISPTTAHRELREINELLADKFSLHVASKPIRITGDENLIRSFYLQYFAERSSLLDWPFEDVDEYKLEEFLKVFFELVGRSTEFSMFRNVKLTVAIALRRYRQGYRIAKHSTILDEAFDELYEKLNNNHIYHHLLKVPITLELLNELFYKYTIGGFFYSYKELLRASIDEEKTTHSYILLTYILDNLSTKFNLPLPNKEELIYNLHSTAILGVHEINAVHLVYDSKSSIHQFVERYHTEFYKDSQEYLKDYLSKIHNNRSPLNLKHLLYTLFSHWRLLFKELNRRMSIYKAAIISSNDIYHSHMLKDVLDTHFNQNQLETSVIAPEAIDKNTLEQLDYDIIIANFTLPDLKDKKSFYVDNMPSYNDIQKIKKYIHFQKINEGN